jgi:hypothetical protein
MISINNILSSSVIQKDDIIDKSFNDVSYFSEALSLLSENNRIYRDFIISLHEATEENKLKTLSNTFNFNIKVFDNIYDYNEKIYNNFNKGLLTSISKYRSLEDNKKFFLFNGKDVCFNMELYKFNTSFIVPTCGKLMEFDEFVEFTILINSGKLSDEQKISKCNEALNDLNKKFANYYYDNCRAKLCNLPKTSLLKSDDYSNELFNTFRTGGDRVTIEINEAVLRDTYKRFTDIKEVDSYIKKEKDNAIKEYKEIRNTLFKEFNINFANDELNYKYKLYLKLLMDQLMTLSNLYLISYSAKLDAVASYYIQDKNVLVETAGKYISTKKEVE